MVVAIVIMVMIVPVALGVPAVFVRIPPSVTVVPAPLAGVMEFVAGAVGFRTVPSMMLSGFVKPVIGPVNALLAVVGQGARSSYHKQQCAEDKRGYRGRPKPFDVSL